MDEDLETLGRTELLAEVRRLRTAIREHRDASGHDLCWHHPDLWRTLPERLEPDIAVPPWPQFLRGCVAYRQSLDERASGTRSHEAEYDLPRPGAVGDTVTVVDHRRQLVRRFYDQVWNTPDVSVVPELLTPGVTFRGSLGAVAIGHPQFIEYVESVTGALGGYVCDLELLVVEDDRAAARLKFSGVHEGTFLGAAPTGRRLSWAGAAFFRFADGLIDDVWVLGDLHGLHQQLEAPG